MKRLSHWELEKRILTGHHLILRIEPRGGVNSIWEEIKKTVSEMEQEGWVLDPSSLKNFIPETVGGCNHSFEMFLVFERMAEDAESSKK